MFCKSLSISPPHTPLAIDGPFNSVTCQWYNNKSYPTRDRFLVEIRKQQYSQWTWKTKQHFHGPGKGDNGFFLHRLTTKWVRNHIQRYNNINLPGSCIQLKNDTHVSTFAFPFFSCHAANKLSHRHHIMQDISATILVFVILYAYH